MASFAGIDDFESYTPSNDLNGGSGGSGWATNWVATASAVTIEGTTVYEGSNSVDLTTTGGEKTAVRTFTAAADGDLFIAFRRETGLTGADGGISFLSGGDYIGYVSINNDGYIKQFYTTGWSTNNVTTYNFDQWYVLNIQWDDAAQDNKYRVRVHDGSSWGSWTSWNATLTASYSTVDRVRVSLNKAATNRTMYIDAISTTDPTSAPAATFVPRIIMM